MSNLKPGDDAKTKSPASITLAKSNTKVTVTVTGADDGSAGSQEKPATSAAKDAGSKTPLKSSISSMKGAEQQPQVAAAKSSVSSVKDAEQQPQETTAKSSTTSTVKEAGSKQQLTAPVVSTESILRQRSGKVEDVKSDRARVSKQGNFHTLCVIEFAEDIPGATVEWLLGKIQAPRSQGGGELSAELVEDPGKVQIISVCFPHLFVVCLASMQIYLSTVLIALDISSYYF